MFRHALRDLDAGWMGSTPSASAPSAGNGGSLWGPNAAPRTSTSTAGQPLGAGTRDLLTSGPIDKTVSTARHAEREAGEVTPVRPAPPAPRPVNPSDPTAGGRVAPVPDDAYENALREQRMVRGLLY